MAPLLPGLSANADQIARTVRAAADHGACFIGSGLLHVDPGIRDYFLGFLTQEYPELLDGYLKLYPGKYANKAYQERMERRVRDAKAAVGYGEDHNRRMEKSSGPRQLSFQLAGS